MGDTNLLSVEFFDLIKSHLNPRGTFFYNTTESDRAMRTGCISFPYGARFSNHLLVSMQPLDWDVERWKKSLLATHIDGKPTLDLTHEADRAIFKQLDTITDISYIAPGRLIEPCDSILARTSNIDVITDDNMGSEWRHMYNIE